MGNINARDSDFPGACPNNGTGKPLSVLKGPTQDLPEMASLHGYFMKLVRDSGHSVAKKTAVIWETQTISFGHLDQFSDALMGILSDMVQNEASGWEPCKIAVHMQPSLDLIIVIFAILKLKAAYVPIDLTFTAERVKRVLRDCHPRMIICDDPQRFSNSITGLPLLNASKLLEIAKQPYRNDSCPVFHKSDQNLPAVVLYTSGSTGNPKAVALSHRLIMNRLVWQWHELAFEAEEIGVLKSVFTFIDSVAEIFGTLLGGRTLLVIPQESVQSPSVFLSVLQRYPVLRIMVVPSFLKALCDYMELESKTFFGPLKVLIASGESLTYDLALRFYEFFPRTKLANFYSATEVAGDVTWIIFEDKIAFEKSVVDTVVPSGKVINNFTLMVVDEFSNPVPKNILGELIITGSFLTMTYLSPDSSFELRTDRILSYKTGDLAFVNPENDLLYIKGRFDDQIRIGGKRFHLSEVEALLHQIPSIRDCAVIKSNDVESDCTKIYAFYYSGDTGAVEDVGKKAKKTVQNNLPPFVQPLFVRCDQPFPLLTNGKIDRKKLSTMLEDKMIGWENIDVLTPSSTLANALGKALNSLQLDKSFVDNGGTSLNTVHTVLKLNQAGFKISLADFLSAKTVREIISRCEWQPPEHESLKPTNSCDDTDFCVVPLNADNKAVFVEILSTAFSEKPNGLLYIIPRQEASDLEHHVDTLLTELLVDDRDACFCFGVIRHNKKVDAVTVAFDRYGISMELQELVYGNGGPMGKLTETVMAPVALGFSSTPGVVVDSYLMAADLSVSSGTCVKLFDFMETELQKRVRRKRFKFIITVNSNLMTQQLAELRGYQRWAAYQANRLVLPDGGLPLSEAPNSLRVTIDVRLLEEDEEKHSAAIPAT